MANRAVLACVEECCRKVMGNQMLFGGKVVVLLGDFRQTCPVVPRGTKVDILNASISRCQFWPQFHIVRLITPIRNAEDPALASFVESPFSYFFSMTHGHATVTNSHDPWAMQRCTTL